MLLVNQDWTVMPSGTLLCSGTYMGNLENSTGYGANCRNNTASTSPWSITTGFSTTKHCMVAKIPEWNGQWFEFFDLRKKYTDCKITAKIGATSNKMGIIARSNWPVSNGLAASAYSYILTNAGSTWYYELLYENGSGGGSTISLLTSTPPSDIYNFGLTIECSGSSIKCYCDGTLTNSVTNTGLTNGYVGCKGYLTSEFGPYTVEDFNPEPTKVIARLI